jgi:hypothetical protein
LAANLSGTNIVVSWVSPGPGFVLQQINRLNGGINGWLDATNTPWLRVVRAEVRSRMIKPQTMPTMRTFSVTKRQMKPCKAERII